MTLRMPSLALLVGSLTLSCSANPETSTGTPANGTASVSNSGGNSSQVGNSVLDNGTLDNGDTAVGANLPSTNASTDVTTSTGVELAGAAGTNAGAASTGGVLGTVGSGGGSVGGSSATEAGGSGGSSVVGQLGGAGAESTGGATTIDQTDPATGGATNANIAGAGSAMGGANAAAGSGAVANGGATASGAAGASAAGGSPNIPGCEIPATVSFQQDVQGFLEVGCGGGNGCHVIDDSSTMGSGGYNHAYDWITAGSHTSSCPDYPMRFEIVMDVIREANPASCSKSRIMPPPDATGAGLRDPLTPCQEAILQAWLNEPLVTQSHREDDSSPSTPYPMPPFN